MRTPEQHLPLRRTEAEQRARQITVGTTSIEVDLTEPAGDTFRSRTTIDFASTGPESFVEFRGRELTTASLNGERLDPRAWRSGRIALRGLQPQNTLMVEGRMAYAQDGEGLCRTVDREDGRIYLYAMSFLDAAPRWFACFDQPDLKARVLLRVRAPAGWTVLGNGPSRQLDDGVWSIAPAGRLPSYLTTLVAGPYVSVFDEHDEIPLGLHARASLAGPLRAEASDLLQVTRCILRLLPCPVRPALRVRGVPPGVRPGLQRRRDGEPGMCDPAGQLPLPQPRHPGRTGPPGRRGGPRDGPHVVRRPGHHALVGRPLAERVLRGVPGPAVLQRGDRISAVDRIRHRPQGLGIRCRPITLEPSGGGQRRIRQPGRAAAVRRHLLRQGRCGAEAAGGADSATSSSSPGCVATSTRSPGATRPSPT